MLLKFKQTNVLHQNQSDAKSVTVSNKAHIVEDNLISTKIVLSLETIGH